MDLYESGIWFRIYVEKNFFSEVTNFWQKFLPKIFEALKVAKWQKYQFSNRNFRRCKNFWGSILLQKGTWGVPLSAPSPIRCHLIYYPNMRFLKKKKFEKKFFFHFWEKNHIWLKKLANFKKFQKLVNGH